MNTHYGCPRCRSDNTRKVSLLHAEGTTRLSGRSGSVGVGLAGGGLGVGVASTNFAGIGVTDLSAQLAPPAARTMSGAKFGTVLIMIVTFAIFAVFESTVAFLIAVAIGGVAYNAMTKQDRRWNRDELPRLIAEWNRKLLCQRCGEIFLGP